MSRFLRALERAGLVHIEPDPASAPEPPTLPASESIAVETPPSGPPVPEPRILPAASASAREVAGGSDAAVIDESISLESLYGDEAVPESPFPAEKMLRLLDGLRAMDAVTRRAAIQAMDAADDAWSIDDAVLDAERKTRALNARKAVLKQQAQAAAHAAQARVAERDAQQQSAVDAIRRQISDLEQLLAREVEKATAEKAAFEAEARDLQQACDRQCARFDAEIERLAEVAKTFAAQ